MFNPIFWDCKSTINLLLYKCLVFIFKKALNDYFCNPKLNCKFMKIKLVLIFLIAFTFKSYCTTPIDSLRQELRKTSSFEEKSKIHRQILAHWISEHQQDSVQQHVNSMMSFAEKSGSDLIIEQLTSANDALFSIGDFQNAEKLNHKYLNSFKKENNSNGLAVCYFNLGRILQFTGNISESAELLAKAQKLIDKKNPLNAAISTNLGSVYGRQGKYTDALQILTDALFVSDSIKDSKNYSGLLFTIGNTYGQINDHETAIGYFERVLTLCRKNGDVLGEANSLINLASANSETEQFEKAEQFARQALDIVKNRNLMAESDVLSVLTDILLHQNKYDELEGFYERMYQIAEITGNEFSSDLADMGMAQLAYHQKNYVKSVELLQKSLPKLEEQGAWMETIPGYELLYKNYTALGDFKNALNASDKFHEYKDSASSLDKVKKLALLQSKLNFQKQELIYEKEQKIRDVVILSLAVIFLMGIGIAIFIFKNKQKLNKQKELLLSSQLEIAEHNLQLSQVKLDDFTKRIQEKSKLIENMEDQLASYADADSELMSQLQQSTILTEDDWRRFKLLFEQVHSGFINRMKEKYPNVSPAEIRYLALSKLQLSTKEMAAALGVSTQSIRTNWYRIRKKIELPEEMTVEELISEI